MSSNTETFTGWQREHTPPHFYMRWIGKFIRANVAVALMKLTTVHTISGASIIEKIWIDEVAMRE